jgi:16S rRNA (guanine527-N7)-methyltransferase
MKGHILPEEMQSIPRGWQVVAAHRVEVPGLDAERHIVEVARA